MAKSEPKTMRFENDVEEYIMKYQGANFSEKFNNLVRFFMKEESKRKEIIKCLDREIQDRQKRLNELQSYLYDAAGLERSFKELQKSMAGCKLYFEKILPKDINAEKTSKPA